MENDTGLDKVEASLKTCGSRLFAPGYFVWAILIANLEEIGYKEKSMHMVAYDWMHFFENIEVHEQTLSRLKSNIELMVKSENK